MDFEKTIDVNEHIQTKEVLLKIYDSLEEKGYNPTNQIVGYLLSGDPAFIPRHKDSRNLIKQKDRDEIIEELLLEYLGKKKDTSSE